MLLLLDSIVFNVIIIDSSVMEYSKYKGICNMGCYELDYIERDMDIY